MLDHLTCTKFVITTSLYHVYKPIKLVKLKLVFSLSAVGGPKLFSDESFAGAAA